MMQHQDKVFMEIKKLYLGDGEYETCRAMFLEARAQWVFIMFF